jgi:AcrR family transcriptional regulator
MAKRAYAAEDKEVRRRTILTAAADLFSQGEELPSVADVAAAAGLAKGTVYLYFRTKGAIFAAILLEGWSAVIDQLEAAFRPTEDARADKVATFLESFVRYLDANPLLLRLDAVVQGLLARELDPDELAAFKETLHRRLAVGGAVVDEALGLPPGRGVQLLMRSHALTRGLWAYVDTSDARAGRMVWPYESDFAKDLGQALSEYWRGALAPSLTAEAGQASPSQKD